MKIFVYGNHSCHSGSAAVTRYIRNIIHEAGHEYIDNETGKLEDADYVIVNGEGSLHDKSSDNTIGGGKLKICRKAKQLGIKSSLINTVWQNNTDPVMIDILKNDIDCVTVRDAVSYNEIKQHRPDAKIVFDLAYHLSVDVKTKKPKHITVGSFFFSPTINFKDHLKSYKRNSIKDYSLWEWDDYLESLSTTKLLITGLHHEVIAACKLRIPFIAYRGNCDKVLGIIKHANVNITVPETPEQLIEQLNKPIDICEYNKLFDFMESKEKFKLKDINIKSKKKKLRAAICISGEPRQYKHTYKSIEKYFKQLDSRWEYDIFIHAWNTTSTPRNYQDGRIDTGHVSEYETEYDIKELRADLIRKYKPKRILVESKNVLRDLVDYYKVKVPAEQIMSSNFLAMSQHISAERSAYLKSGKNIILPSQEIVGEESNNEYDLVIKTRFDVMFFPKRCQLDTIHAKISRFERKEYTRTEYGMTFFPTLTVRNGRLAAEFGHFWSGNIQFDMMYDSLFRRLHTNSDVDIYESCHHQAFASHCMNQGLCMREWRRVTKPSKTLDPEGGRDFIWVMPGAPFGEHPISTYRTYYKRYAKEHEKRMKVIDTNREDEIKRLAEQQRKADREYETGMALVHAGKKKDIWYNDKVYFVNIKDVVKVEDTDTATLPNGLVVMWCDDSEEWLKAKESYQTS